MNRKLLVFLGGLFLAAALPFAWWLAAPLFVDNVVNESFPGETAVVEAAPVAADVEVADPAWELLFSGTFRDADPTHRGSGTAAIYRQGDELVLRFEDFEVTNGPDLHVLLVENVDADSQEGMGEYLDLGSLRGNVGSQNYTIPAGTDLSRFSGVMIYCQPFHVVFATAPLTAGS